MLGRALGLEEVQYVAGLIRRIAAIALMGDKLDANYRAVRDNACSWPLSS